MAEMSKLNTAKPEAPKARPLIKWAEDIADQFSRAGDHQRHATVHDLAIAAVAFKLKIAAVRGKVPDELAAAVGAVDALL